jgi:hypothetical protein
MKTKTMAVIGMLSWCLYAPAAHSADATFNVNGKTITCSVKDIDTSFGFLGGPWTSFNLKYEFCNGNYKIFACFVKNNAVDCVRTGGANTQDCNGSRYDFLPTDKTFELKPNTPNAQQYVCEKHFNLGILTVTPLN